MKRITVVILALFAFQAISCGVNFSNGSGRKIGQIVKLSKQGFSNKTWEGQLIRGGMSGGSGAFGAVPFNFTIEGDELAHKAQEYMDKQTEVVLDYEIEGVYSACRTESDGHFARSIQPAATAVESDNKSDNKK